MKDKLIKECEKQIGKALSDALVSYDSPLTKCVKASLLEVEDEIKKLTSDAVSDLISDNDFRSVLKVEVQRKLAKVLISKIGGEIEKTVNTLNQDPVTRSRLTVAIDSVMSDIKE